MDNSNSHRFIEGLQKAWLAEQKSLRLYKDLAKHEANTSRRGVLLRLADNEQSHADRWAKRLNELGAPILEVHPENHHQRTALYVGSKRLVEDIARTLKG